MDIFPRATLWRQAPTRICGFLWSWWRHPDYRRPLLSVALLSIFMPTKTSSVQHLCYPERALTSSLALSSSPLTARRQHLWYIAVTLKQFCCLREPLASIQKLSFLYNSCRHWVMTVPASSKHPSKYSASPPRHARDRHIITSVNMLQREKRMDFQDHAKKPSRLLSSYRQSIYDFEKKRNFDFCSCEEQR